MNKSIVASLVAGCVVLMGSAAGAEVLTVTADRDNTLYEDDQGGTSNGVGMHFFAGLTNNQDLRRGLLHFDVSSIPPGSSIDSVILTLNMSMTIAGPQPVSLHRASADWGEGASDAPGPEGGGDPAQPGDATWLHTFFDTDFWATPGGDFAPAASATTMVDQEGVYTWGTTAGMAADVSAWVNAPSQNFGWVVTGGEAAARGQGGGTAKRFDTREIGNEGLVMPQLDIVYTAPVPVELQSFEVD